MAFSTPGISQTINDFEKDLQESLKPDFSEEDLNKIFRAYSLFLTPHSDITQLTANIKGERLSQYPLYDFKEKPLYKNNIRSLANSENTNHRILAYLLIAGAGDTTFESTLLRKIKEEKDKGALIWSGMALMHLKSNRTTPLFDFLIENETFGDAHMLPLFLRLNPDSLQQTAYARINSDPVMARILAAQVLGYTKLNPKTESLLKKVVAEWPIEIKGYAIYPVKQLQIGDLLDSFQPLLDSQATRKIALQALANSPTKRDRDYIKELVNQQDTVSEELLDSFYNSQNVGNIKYWLTLLSSKPIHPDYFFLVHKQPLLQSDSVLPDLHHALITIKDPGIVARLVRALQGREDETSTEMLLRFLRHEDSGVRHWAASALNENRSPKIAVALPALLKNPSLRTSRLTGLAIDNKADNLQSVYEQIYKTEKDTDWQRSSIEYLSAFPLKKHKKLFREILKDPKAEIFIKQDAALGLGRLNDANSVSLIAKVAGEEAIKESDFNARVFIVALGKIKTEESKKEIEKYKESKEQVVREVVEEILNGW